MAEEEKKEVVQTNAETPTEPKQEAVEEGKGVDIPQVETKPSGSETPKAEEKKVQSSEYNALQAQMRREREAREKEKKEYEARIQALESERREGISENALKDLGFTRNDLKDSQNMELARNYVKALSEGAENPLAKAYQDLYRSAKEFREKEEADRQATIKAKEEEQRIVSEDIANFHKSYPGVDLAKECQPDSEFRKLFGNAPGFNGNVTTYYGIYRSIKGIPAVNEEDKAKSNPPFGGSRTNPSNPSLQEKVSRMSKSEYEAWRNKVLHK